MARGVGFWLRRAGRHGLPPDGRGVLGAGPEGSYQLLGGSGCQDRLGGAEAREEQSAVETRIFELEELLRRAVVIKKTEGSDHIEVGSKVTVKKNGNISEYTIVGSNESKPEEGKISNESPIGRALLGKRVGDSITVATPAGQAVYQITKIE